MPKAFDGYTNWTHGTSQHSSESRKILGSVILNARTSFGQKVSIRHLVLDGSSQCGIRKNVTRHADIIHNGRDALKLPIGDRFEFIDLIEHEFLSYMHMSTSGIKYRIK